MKLGETAKEQDRHWAEWENGRSWKGRKKNGRNGKNSGGMGMREMGLCELGINYLNRTCVPPSKYGHDNDRKLAKKE